MAILGLEVSDDLGILPAAEPAVVVAADVAERGVDLRDHPGHRRLLLGRGRRRRRGERQSHRREQPPPPPAHGASARVRTSSVIRATNASADITSCFFPAPRTRSARLSLSASRWPTMAMYGTLPTSPSRIR